MAQVEEEFDINQLKGNPQKVDSSTKCYGGEGGNEFTWSNMDEAYSLKKIRVKSGTYIDGIELCYSNSKDNAISPYFGGEGGFEQIWEIPEGQEIRQVQIWSGTYVDSLKFITDKGTISPKFGGQGGICNVLNLPLNSNIVGICGKNGDFIDRLGFIIAQKKDTK